MDFNENLEMTRIVVGGAGNHVICVIMTSLWRIAYEHWYDTHPLYLNTFLTIEKMQPHNYD